MKLTLFLVMSLSASGMGLPSFSARYAAPSASKYEASSGMMNSISGAFSLMNRTIWRFLVIPPTSMTLPLLILAFLRKSMTFTAITLLRERTMSSLVASPLLSRWVQSLFMNTEQRVESSRIRAVSGTPFTSSSFMSMRASCCLKNSPVPDAHLLPEKLFIILPSSLRVYTTRSSPPRETMASALSFSSLSASSIQRGSTVLFTEKRNRPSVPVAKALAPDSIG